MPSTTADIQVGAIFRPRVRGNKCVKMRKNDTVKINAYASPNVALDYVSDGFKFIVDELVLLAEYKLDKAPVVKSIMSQAFPNGVPPMVTSPLPVLPQKPQPPMVTSMEATYPIIGSRWVCESNGGGFMRNVVFTVVSHNKVDQLVEYSYGGSGSTTNFKTLEVFDLYAKPYGNQTPTRVKTKPEPVIAVVSIVCKHLHTDWYGEVESCKDCGDTLRTLPAASNPYNVDPDLKAIPPAVTAFMNRYGRQA
jgi:hypothetical protein